MPSPDITKAFLHAPPTKRGISFGVLFLPFPTSTAKHGAK